MCVSLLGFIFKKPSLLFSILFRVANIPWTPYMSARVPQSVKELHKCF